MVYGGHANGDQEEVENDEDLIVEEGSNRCPIIKLTKEEKRNIHRPWKLVLIIKVLGRKVGYNCLLNRIKPLWHPKSKMDLVAIEYDYFVVKFGSVDDYEYAKYEGPWMVMDHYLITKEWVPNFDPFQDTMEKIIVWVRFSSLHMEFCGGYSVDCFVVHVQG